MYQYLINFNIGQGVFYASNYDDAFDQLYEHLLESFEDCKYKSNVIDLVMDLAELEQSTDPDITEDNRLTLEERNR